MAKFSCVFLDNHTNKIEAGTTYTCGITNSKPPGPIIIINELEILSLSQVQFITLLFGGAQLCFARASCTNLVRQFPELNSHILTFTHLIVLSGVTY